MTIKAQTMEAIQTKMTSKGILRTLLVVKNVSQNLKDSGDNIGTTNPYPKKERKQ